jgi:hypothetical protein
MMEHNFVALPPPDTPPRQRNAGARRSKESRPKAKGEDEARQALRAWLALTQEYLQDGFYRFEILGKDFAVEDSGRTIRGRAVVMQGGNGELAVTRKFKDGKLATIDEIAKIQAGVRPICQATKLRCRSGRPQDGRTRSPHHGPSRRRLPDGAARLALSGVARRHRPHLALDPGTRLLGSLLTSR